MRQDARLLGLMLLVLALIGCLEPDARAAERAQLFASFATENFNEIDNAVSALAASGDEKAQTLLSALADRRLFYSPADKHIVLKDESGKSLDALTGAALAAFPGGLKPVRINNRVRATIDAALGSLTLMAADPAKRREAAETEFKSRNATSLGAIETALAKEADPTVKRAMQEARAALVIGKADATQDERLDAVKTIRERGDQDALSLVAIGRDGRANRRQIRGGCRCRRRREPPRALGHPAKRLVRAVARLGAAARRHRACRHLRRHGRDQHGAWRDGDARRLYELRDSGGDAQRKARRNIGLALALAIPAAFLVSGIAGVVIERCVIRFLYGRPLETLLATFGISLVLQQAVRSGFGPTNREVDTPAFMSGAFELGGMQITLNRLAIMVFAVAVFAALQLVLRFTSFGLRTRAVTQNRRMASSMGIRTNAIDALTFGLGSGIAGLAGVALSQIDNVSPNLGQGYIIDSFLVVVFGGVGNLWGTLIGALSIGMANKFLEPFAGAVLGKIALLVFIILFIQKRPRGLFALKGRAVEA